MMEIDAFLDREGIEEVDPKEATWARIAPETKQLGLIVSLEHLDQCTVT